MIEKTTNSVYHFDIREVIRESSRTASGDDVFVGGAIYGAIFAILQLLDDTGLHDKVTFDLDAEYEQLVNSIASETGYSLSVLHGGGKFGGENEYTFTLVK